MSKNHFVAIGGTGQHVALSYADLAVLAEWFAPRAPTAFWLIDADASGKSEARSAWGELLLQASFLRRRSDAGSLQWPDPAANHHKPYVDVPNKAEFGQLLDPEFGPVFFADQQRSVKYSNGYYGHAAVASTVFGEIIRDLTPKTGAGAQSGVGDGGTSSGGEAVDGTDRRERHGANGSRLAALLGSPVGDQESRIVVAGSAVGGTGSGCVPKLIEEISAVSGAQRKPLALLYLPWFKLDGDPSAHLRNQDMLARMASGLIYYRDRLAKHAAAVLVGHPNVEGSNRPRKWAGDTQQPVHADLTLPAYGALAAAQYFDAPKSRDAGLYTIVSPRLADGGTDRALHLFPWAPASHVAEGDRDALSIGVLWERNVEWLRRVVWLMEWIRSRPAQSTPRLGGAFDIPDLKAAGPEWLPDLRAAAEAKWRALRRFGESFKGGDAIEGGPNFPLDAEFNEAGLRSAMPLSRGVAEIRDWFAAPVRTAEELCAALANSNPAKKERLDGDKYTSTQRLLPPRVGSAMGGADPVSAAIGTLAVLDSAHSKDLIHAQHVSAYAIPNARSREFVLQCIFDGSLLQGVDLGALLKKKDLSDAETLLANWALLLTGLAAGSVKVGAKVSVPSTPQQLDLHEQLRGAMPETPFDEAKTLLWYRQGKPPQVVGYTSERTLLVPAALDRAQWDSISADLAGVRRVAAQDAVRAWGRFVGRLAAAAGGEYPGWVKLVSGWGATLTQHVMFGMDQELRVQWPGRGILRVRAPQAGGRADAGWGTLFSALGLMVTNEPPAVDQDALEIDHFLRSCPLFTYFPATGTPEERRCIWTLSGVPEINLKAGRAIQERYYISSVSRSIWQVSASTPIEIVGNNILLERVGYIDDDQDRRYPELPIDEAYVDLVDTSAMTSKPHVEGEQIHYSLPLRGMAAPMPWTAKVDGELITRAGCLLWPSFAAPGWTQRYSWVNTMREGGLTLRIYASGADARVRSSVSVPVPKASAYPIGWPAFAAGAWRPRLLALRPEGQHGRAGVHLLSMSEAHRVEGEEAWGVDFGTSGSAIAVNRGGGVEDAVMLRPEGRLDATYRFVLGEDVPLSIAKWFPSWDKRGPRMGAPGVVPTRMVFRSALNVREASFIQRVENYGSGWMLDYGGQLDGVKNDQLKSEFKWGPGVSPYRRAYLLRLLELASAWRARAYERAADSAGSADPQLPARVKIVFTVPIRMRDEVRGFEDDVAWVIAELSRMTGIQFSAAYQWESRAGACAPGARKAGIIYCALDLGGGSLDLWGAFTNGAGTVTSERADSVLLGGRNFLELAKWTDRAVDAFRGMQTGDKIWKFLPQEDVSKTRTRFFELVTEAAARWIVAFEHEAMKSGIASPAIEVGLLGRAWALGGKDWEETASALLQIQQRAKALGLKGTITANALIPTAQEERKTYLARFVSYFHHGAPTHLGDTPNPGTFTGANLDLVGASPRSLAWSLPLPQPLGPDDKLHLRRDDVAWVRAEESLKRIAPGCVEVDDVLSRHGEEYLRTAVMLRRNALHDLLERLVK